MLLIGGIPLFYMELALGQHERKGAITTWGNLVPIFKVILVLRYGKKWAVANGFNIFSQGIGWSVVLIAFYVDFFYNVIIAWSLRFFFASITDVLPWTSCGNYWNTNSCKPVSQNLCPFTYVSFSMLFHWNKFVNNSTINKISLVCSKLHSISSSISDFADIFNHLAILQQWDNSTKQQCNKSHHSRSRQ